MGALGTGAGGPCSCPTGMRTWLEEMLPVGGVQELLLGLLEHIGKQRLPALLPQDSVGILTLSHIFRQKSQIIYTQ